MPDSFEQPSSQEANPKGKQWEDTLQSLDLITDRLSHPIEPGIKEVCAAFIVNGLPTTQSCEGHFDDHGLPYPWVDIGPSNDNFDDDLKTKIDFVDRTHRTASKKAEEEILSHFGVDEIDYDDKKMVSYFDKILEENLGTLYHQYEEEIRGEERKLTQEYIEKLVDIFKMYKPLDPRFVYSFTISYSKTRIRVKPLNAQFDKASESEKKVILEKTRLEISHIGQILKNIFFSN